MMPHPWHGLALLPGLIALHGCGGAVPASSEANAADRAAINALIDEVETTFAAADLDGAMAIFTDDAMIIAPATPNVVGADAIRTMYAGMLAQFEVDADQITEEIRVAGDLAYERGSYSLRLTDRSSGQVVQDVVNRHMHILRRQPDGRWKTWRMMVNSAEAAAE
jgi:uncharacterized protein (TIGR02246 family)